MIVQTKEELKRAKENKIEDIIIKGELATKIKKAKKLTEISAVALAAITSSVVMIPFIGVAGLGPVAAFTGVEVAVIVLAVSVGISLILAVFKDYQEISFEPGPPSKLVLKRRADKA